jgi:RNA polymerase sigma-70 factor (ECF subfamily)
VVLCDRIEPAADCQEDLAAARLVTRFQAGETDAFVDLYQLYFDRVYGYLRVAFGDLHMAEDGAQQIFTQALEALPRYRRQAQPFRAWLFVIVRNLAVSELKKRSRLEVTDPIQLTRDRELAENGNGGGLAVLSWLTDRDLTMLIERLPLAQRQVLLLRFNLDLSLKQAAAVLGKTPNDVAALQHRAIAFLRTRLAALGRAPSREGGARMRAWVKPAQVLRRRRMALLG